MVIYSGMVSRHLKQERTEWLSDTRGVPVTYKDYEIGRPLYNGSLYFYPYYQLYIKLYHIKRVNSINIKLSAEDLCHEILLQKVYRQTPCEQSGPIY